MYILYIRHVKYNEVQYNLSYNNKQGSDIMLILAKSILGMMIGFFLAVVLGWFLIPVLKKLKCKQSISVFTAFSCARTLE